jgi:DNA-binding MarR family transcriptional regulator
MKERNRSNSSPGRRALHLATRKAGRELGMHSSLFHSLIAQWHQLTTTDMRAWDLLLLNGPMNHGRLAQLTGLSGGAVTGVIHKLERAGAVTREPDPTDGRKIIVQATGSVRDGPLRSFFDQFEQRVEKVLSGYSATELDVSRRLLEQMGQLLLQEATRLRLELEQDLDATERSDAVSRVLPRQKRAGVLVPG